MVSVNYFYIVQLYVTFWSSTLSALWVYCSRLSGKQCFYCYRHEISFFFVHLPIIVMKNALYHSVQVICQIVSATILQFLGPELQFKKACLLLCSFSIVKQINSNPDSLPIVFHYEERRPDTNHNRTLKCPAHYSVCARNTNQLTRHTFNKCKLCANLGELSGALSSIFISSSPLFTNSKNNPGVNLRGKGNGGLTVSTISLPSLHLLSLPLPHRLSPLLPSPSSPLPLFSLQSPLPCSLHAV